MIEKFANSKEDLSHHLGFSSRYITSLLKAGAPKKTEHGYSIPAWVKFLVDKAKVQKKKDSPLYKADLEYRKERARKLKIERQQLEGKLVNKRQFMFEEMDRLTEIRQTFMRLARKVSAKAANKPAPEVIAVIDAEVRRIFRYFEELYTRGHEIKKGMAKFGRPTNNL